MKFCDFYNVVMGFWSHGTVVIATIQMNLMVTDPF